MQYRTLKISAGRHSFRPDQIIDLPDDEAAMLMADGAVVPLDPKPVAERPKSSRRNRQNAVDANSRTGGESGDSSTTEEAVRDRE